MTEKRNWDEIIQKVKQVAFEMAKQERDGKIIQKNLWYAVVGQFGIQDTSSDYTAFKRANVKARREDPAYNAIFKDEDRYRKFEWIGKWKVQRSKVVLSTEKKTMQSFFEDIADYFGCGLFVTRGNCSETVLQELDEVMDDNTVILHCGDFNPKGYEIWKTMQERYGKRKVKLVLMTPYWAYKHPDVPKPVTKPRGAKKELQELWKRKGWKTVELDAYVVRYRDEARRVVAKAILRYINKDVWISEDVKEYIKWKIRDARYDLDYRVRRLLEEKKEVIKRKIGELERRHPLAEEIEKLRRQLEELERKRDEELRQEKDKLEREYAAFERRLERDVTRAMKRLEKLIAVKIDEGVRREEMIKDLENMRKVYVYIDMEKEAELRRLIKRFEEKLGILLNLRN